MNYKATIILPCYNKEKYIERALKSIIAQSRFKEFEVIIVDDCSTDKTVSIIRKYEKKYKNISLYVLEKGSGSPSKPRNIGMEKSTTDYIIFMDPDDQIINDGYSTLLTKMEEYKSDILIATRIGVNNYGEKVFTDFICEEYFNDNSYDIQYELLIHPPYILKTIYSKKLIDKYNIRFNEKITTSEDEAFCVECAARAKKITKINDIVYQYTAEAEGSVTTNVNMKIFSDIYDICEELERTYKLSFSPVEISERVAQLIYRFYLNKLTFLKSPEEIEEACDLIYDSLNKYGFDKFDNLVTGKYIDMMDNIKNKKFDYYIEHYFVLRMNKMKKIMNKQNKLLNRKVVKFGVMLVKFITKVKKRIKKIKKSIVIKKQYYKLKKIILDKKYKYVFVFYPYTDWNLPVFQRPQQIALSLTKRKDILYLYGTKNHLDKVNGLYKNIRDNLILFTDYNLINKIKRSNIVLHLYSTDKWSDYSIIEKALNNNQKVCYEYIDDISESITGKHTSHYLDKHNKILKNEDIYIVATANNLLNNVKKLRKKNYVLSTNGVNPEDFKKPSKDIPEKIKELKTKYDKLICYYGSLATWFDYNLLKKCALKYPNYAFILIGYLYDSSYEDSGIKKIKNIIYLGKIPYNELINYTSRVDLLTIPFLVNDVTKATSPVKLFEYMATKKPILTTDLPECKKYKSVMVEKADNYVKKIPEAIEKNNDPNYIKLLEKDSLSNTWDSKANIILEMLFDDNEKK